LLIENILAGCGEILDSSQAARQTFLLVDVSIHNQKSTINNQQL
jgi:hypothetical protein